MVKGTSKALSCTSDSIERKLIDTNDKLSQIEFKFSILSSSKSIAETELDQKIKALNATIAALRQDKNLVVRQLEKV